MSIRSRGCAEIWRLQITCQSVRYRHGGIVLSGCLSQHQCRWYVEYMPRLRKRPMNEGALLIMPHHSKYTEYKQYVRNIIIHMRWSNTEYGYYVRNVIMHMVWSNIRSANGVRYDHVQPIAFAVSYNLNLRSHWSLSTYV